MRWKLWPKDILIAGYPRDMDDIPVLARRSVLVNYKLFHSWFVDYRLEMDRRTKAALRALYARDVADINYLHETWGVDYFVVSPEHFSPIHIASGAYKEPYNDFIRELADDPRPLFFQNIQPELILWSDPDRFVVRLPAAALPQGET